MKDRMEELELKLRRQVISPKADRLAYLKKTEKIEEDIHNEIQIYKQAE
jgi:hypothetical protein